MEFNSWSLNKSKERIIGVAVQVFNQREREFLLLSWAKYLLTALFVFDACVSPWATKLAKWFNELLVLFKSFFFNSSKSFVSITLCHLSLLIKQGVLAIKITALIFDDMPSSLSAINPLIDQAISIESLLIILLNASEADWRMVPSGLTIES